MLMSLDLKVCHVSFTISRGALRHFALPEFLHGELRSLSGPVSIYIFINAST